MGFAATRWLGSAALSVMTIAASVPGQAGAPGSPTQLPGLSGCIARKIPGCTRDPQLRFPLSVAVSHDGRNVYVPSMDAHTLLTFLRDPATGALRRTSSPASCVSDRATASCERARGAGPMWTVTISSDDRRVYAGAAHAVLAFSRDPSTGDLTQLPGRSGCVSSPARDGCRGARGLRAVDDLDLAPDGRTLYAGGRAEVVLAVGGSGALRQLPGRRGCISASHALSCSTPGAFGSATEAAVTPDGRNVYVASSHRPGILAFSRRRDGSLRQLAGRDGCLSVADRRCRSAASRWAWVDDLAVEPGGAAIYAGLDTGELVRLRRDPATGRLTQPRGPTGCLTRPTGHGCPQARGTSDGYGLAVSPDGSALYIAGEGLAFLRRAAPSGAFKQPAGPAGCLSEDAGDGCASARALGAAVAVALSPDGRNLYAVSSTDDAIDAFDVAGVRSFHAEATQPGLISAEAGAQALTAGGGRLVWSHSVSLGHYTLREWDGVVIKDLPIAMSTRRQHPRLGLDAAGRRVVAYVRCSAGKCGGYTYEFATGREHALDLPHPHGCQLRGVAVWRRATAYRLFSYNPGRHSACGDWVIFPGQPARRVAGPWVSPQTSLGDLRAGRMGWVRYPVRHGSSYVAVVGTQGRDGRNHVVARSRRCTGAGGCDVTGDGPLFDGPRTYAVFDYAYDAGGTDVDITRVVRRRHRTCTASMNRIVPAHDPQGDSWGDIAVDRGRLYYAAAKGIFEAPNEWSMPRCHS